MKMTTERRTELRHTFSETCLYERSLVEAVLDDLEETERELARIGAEKDLFKAVLIKIDAIRNSIIGFQRVNWSEHIYPLVAALDEAGFEGAEYEKARADAGTLLEQIKRAEQERDAALACETVLREFIQNEVLDEHAPVDVCQGASPIIRRAGSRSLGDAQPPRSGDAARGRGGARVRPVKGRR
jgi:hypothetical protein